MHFLDEPGISWGWIDDLEPMDFKILRIVCMSLDNMNHNGAINMMMMMIIVEVDELG